MSPTSWLVYLIGLSLWAWVAWSLRPRGRDRGGSFRARWIHPARWLVCGAAFWTLTIGGHAGVLGSPWYYVLLLLAAGGFVLAVVTDPDRRARIASGPGGDEDRDVWPWSMLRQTVPPEAPRPAEPTPPPRSIPSPEPSHRGEPALRDEPAEHGERSEHDEASELPTPPE